MTSEEIAAVVREIRERVRARHETQVPTLPGVRLPSLTPLSQARDAAEGKVASIGTVNPRRPGLVNSFAQTVKKAIARAMAWHVREQVEFNRAVMQCLDRIQVVLEEQNRHFRMGLDAFRHLQEWRTGWEERWTETEIRFLRSVAELEAALRHRTEALESSYRDHSNHLHADYRKALEQSSLELQQKLWDDLARLREEQERVVNTELRLIRQRAQYRPEPPPAPQARPPEPAAVPGIDYARFAERFRGAAGYVSAQQKFYLPYFQGRSHVVDLGCGRGEFLDLMVQDGIGARGVDCDPESVALCREKQLEVEQADLFEYLARQADESLDGIFSAQVVEHLPPHRTPELVALAGRKLESGGILVIETPNPECLAIFATNFYVDPTHVRPVPSAQLHFYMEENGFGRIEVHQLAPAAEVFPEIAALGRVEALAGFQKKFFGGLDYAIIGRKL
ncbi:MAG: class I SAM-dependent methyltransferase [Acidobacteria bacterium]|nr:class I SAM-dependent methyltransferase [Acidobacteriota bacterium]